MNNFQHIDVQSRLKDLSPKSILIFLAAVLLFTSLIAYGFSQSRSSNTIPGREDNTSSPALTAAPYTIVYGTWTSTESKIIALDISTNSEYVLANLPLSIKKVSILSPTKLLYIANTNTHDHGDEIGVYDIQTKEYQSLFSASDSFGIDDYVLSPDKEYIAIWEVRMNSESGVLLGGQSRVYTGKISTPHLKNSIYDEQSTESNPVRYPRAILNDGTVIMDRFLPNSGAGWAYGMSVSNFMGTQITDIVSMQNGTYGSQPILSPDGKYLVFAGYDGNQNSGADNITGFRKALVSPNTIELLDTQTHERTKLNGISPLAIYSDIKWGINSNEITYSAVFQNSENNGSYVYSLITNSAQQLETNHDYTLLTALPSKFYIGGTPVDSASHLGNLGDSYRIPYTHLSLVNGTTLEKSSINTSANQIQYITTISNSQFLDLDTLPIQPITSHDELQLQTFYLKPTLAQQRETQQSKIIEEEEIAPTEAPRPLGNKPACWGLAREQCNEMLGTNYTGVPNPLTEPEYHACRKAQNHSNVKAGLCQGSPLYLYGPEGLPVTVTIHTQIYDSNAPHTENTYSMSLGKNGSMYIEKSEYQSIEYNYTSALRIIRPPKSGRIVKKSEVEKTLRDYAGKLGLNTKETQDLITYGHQSATGNYILVSFFDHETSHAILPITFTPQPDVYRNIVFYFKNFDSHPNYNPVPPTFNKIQRQGFTAIEISSYVE